MDIFSFIEVCVHGNIYQVESSIDLLKSTTSQKIFELLLSSGLCASSTYGNLESCLLLIQNGADVNY